MVISDVLLAPLMVHVLGLALLYAGLTLLRAPSVWGLGAKADGSNPWADWEPRVSANLRNQFEWPMLFYGIVILLMARPDLWHPAHAYLAWGFIAGRIAHSAVQIATRNVRLRGLVFTINFAAVLAMWGLLLV